MDEDWDLEVALAKQAQHVPAQGSQRAPDDSQGWVGRGRGQRWAVQRSSQGWGGDSISQGWGAQAKGQIQEGHRDGQNWRGQSNGQSRGGQSSDQSRGGQSSDQGWRGQSSDQSWRGQSSDQSWRGQSSDQSWRGQSSDQGWRRQSSDRGWRRQSGDRGWDGQRAGRGCCGGGGGGGWQDRPLPGPAGTGADPGPLTLMIPSADVSRVIGRAGANIRELEANSGARIRIDRCGGGPEARVDFIGDESSRERAKLLVEQFLLDFDEQRPAPGRRGRSPSPQPRRPAAAADRPVFSLSLALQMQAEGDKERWNKVPPIEKNFYEEDPEVTAMTEDELKRVRAEMNDIHVTSDDKDDRLPNPVMTFDQAFRPYPEILDEIRKVGFEKPTPIQAQGWPVLLSGRDMIGIAQTGSGKTLAFLLPALIHTDRQPIPRADRGGPNVLVLSPTRELALQTEREVQRYNYRGIRSVCVYGGGDRRTQVKSVCSGVEIVIATPGRLNDLVQAGYIDVTSITYLVLDEADRMLDMGFEPEIRKVLLDIRPDRQTVMTSATWPVDVRRIADKYMTSPIHVVVGSLDLKACRTVEQIIVFCRDEEEKKEKLNEYLYNMGPDEKIIVFFGRKAKASQLSIDYGVNGVDLQSIHGDRPQEEREIAIEDMQTGSCRVLFATDVASRGIDIADVSLIVNFDFPRHIEDYVHRVGRTGRAGKSGRAVTLMVREDWRHAAELIDILHKNQAEVPDWLVQMAERFEQMKTKREAAGGDRGSRRGFGGRGRPGGRDRRNDAHQGF